MTSLAGTFMPGTPMTAVDHTDHTDVKTFRGYECAEQVRVFAKDSLA